MTIEETIKHCEEVAHQNEILMKRYDDASGYSRSHNEQIRTSGAIGCESLVNTYRQLAEWLRELKAYRENQLALREYAEQVRKKTNGDVIMAMFPNCQPCVGSEIVDTDIAVFESEWWNTPYTKLG